MFRLIRRILRQLHCAHVNVRGIYGDEINHTPGGRRIQCRVCGALLDGPVSLAVEREINEARTHLTYFKSREL